MIDFLIVGCPRSGTTLLSKMLTTHKDVLIPDETGFLYYSFGFSSKYKSRTVVKNIKQIFQCSHEYDPQYMQSFSGLLLAMRDCYLGENKFLGEKTPRHWYYLDVINREMPKAKVVFMIRNPFSVVNSYKKYKQNWFPFYKAIQLFHADIFFPMFVWRSALNSYKENENKQYFLIKYEDLVNNPGDTLREMCLFLGLDYDDQMLSFYQVNNKVSELVATNFNDQDAHKNLSKSIDSERVCAMECLNSFERYIISRFLSAQIKRYYPNMENNVENKGIFEALYYVSLLASSLMYTIVVCVNKMKNRVQSI